MLPDFRNVVGAFLAMAVLFVAGLGLVASARLVRDAHMAPIEESRTLAYAGHPEWNQFYDPDGGRRSAGLESRGESASDTKPPAVAEDPKVAVTSPITTPTRGLAMPNAAAVNEKPAPLDPASLDSPPSRASEPVAVSSSSSGSPGNAPATDAAQLSPRMASAPLPSAAADPPDDQRGGDPKPAEPATDAEAPAPPLADVAPEAPPPIPLSRPKLRPRRRIARARPQETQQNNQQAWPQNWWQNPGTSTTSTPGSSYGPTNTARKVAGKPATPGNRPQ
ncbi:MAG TPA: hypothetical protein VKW08_03520 [Xanthobacteraceae bacterium]|nr:hypothetical protein [Xanthobacteraceae bacterium]